MKKVLVGIPCFNEEDSILTTLHSLNSINFDKEIFEISIVIVNDGSIDETLNLLKESKIEVDIISSPINYGLSEVFNSLMHFSRNNNFDYLIIYDADGQYPSDEIPKMIDIAINSNSDILIGCRNFSNNKVFSNFKNFLQKAGSFIIGKLLSHKLTDASSGFRIYSRKATKILFTDNNFSYTVETLFQAKFKNLKISQHLLNNFYKTRDSRLFKNNFEYIRKTLIVILKSLILYRTKKVIFFTTTVLSLPGFIILSRFFIPYIQAGFNPGNIQSLIFGVSYILFLTMSLIFVLIKVDNIKKFNLIKQSLFSPKHEFES
jgi:glycosyltransferase involved in cell wall biosynthesis